MQALVSPTPHSLIPTVTQICAKHTSHPCPATTPCLQVYTRSWCLHPALGRVCAAALLPAPFRVTFALFPQPQEHSPQPLYSCALCLERSAPCPPRLPPLTSISAWRSPLGVAPDPVRHHPIGILRRAEIAIPCPLVLDSLALSLTR